MSIVVWLAIINYPNVNLFLEKDIFYWNEYYFWPRFIKRRLLIDLTLAEPSMKGRIFRRWFSFLSYFCIFFRSETKVLRQ